MVGGLVEHQHVVVAGQQRGQRDPAALAAGQVADQLVPGQVADQAGHHVADLRVPGPLVLGPVADDGGADGERGVEGVGLVEHADPHAAPHGDAAAVGGQPSGEQGEQGGLAVAVAADDAHPVALVEAHGHRVEDVLGGEGQVQRFAAEQVGHPASLRASNRLP